MKISYLFFVLSFALVMTSCANRESSLFEDTGKKIDQGIQKSGEKVDEGLTKAGEKVKKATH